MKTCSFCGDPGHLNLDGEPICYDCVERCSFAPPEERRGVLLDSLNRLHGALIKATRTPLVTEWLDKLAHRLSVLRGEEVEVKPAIVKPAPPVKVSTGGGIKVRRRA